MNNVLDDSVTIDGGAQLTSRRASVSAEKAAAQKETMQRKIAQRQEAQKKNARVMATFLKYMQRHRERMAFSQYVDVVAYCKRVSFRRSWGRGRSQSPLLFRIHLIPDVVFLLIYRAVCFGHRVSQMAWTTVIWDLVETQQTPFRMQHV